MPSAPLPLAKRLHSSDTLDGLDGQQLPAKRQEREAGGLSEVPAAAAPLMAAFPGESQAAFFARLRSRLRSAHLLTTAAAFERDGLYIYKRPVRSESGEKAALLASGGSVFHHVVLYAKQGQQLTALEFAPGNAMDITSNMLAEAAPAPVLLRPAPLPEPQHLPMLHIAVAHHPLGAEGVQQALRFAEGQSYHALKNNCIAFADFAVRVLTGGAVRGAPLLFDLIAGTVPLADPPMLQLLGVMLQLHWTDVCDGSRLLRAYLRRHPGGLPPPPAGAEAVGLLEEGADLEPAGPAAAKLAPVPLHLAPETLSALTGLLPPGMALPAGAATPAAAPDDGTSDSDDTVAGAALAGLDASSVGTACCAANTSTSARSSRVPLGGRGMALPPRKARK